MYLQGIKCKNYDTRDSLWCSAQLKQSSANKQLKMHEQLVCFLPPPASHSLWELSSRQVAGQETEKERDRGRRSQRQTVRETVRHRECAALGSLAYATSQSVAALTDAPGRNRRRWRGWQQHGKERKRERERARAGECNILYISVQPQSSTIFSTNYCEWYFFFSSFFPLPFFAAIFVFNLANPPRTIKMFCSLFDVFNLFT